MERRGSNLMGTLAVALGLSAAAAGGCMFTTRTPEPPPSGVWTPDTPIDPQTVLKNIQGSFEHLDPSSYRGCLADTFLFVPDPGEISVIGDFTQWDREAEGSAFTDVFNKCSRVTFQWSRPPENEVPLSDPDHPASTSYEYFKDLGYTIVFTTKAGLAVTSSCISNLYMKEDPLTQRWSLWKWTERSDGTGHESLGFVRYNRGP